MLPTAIFGFLDPVFVQISTLTPFNLRPVYGPTWWVASSLLQWVVTLIFKCSGPAAIVRVRRAWWSGQPSLVRSLLIWSITTGHLQRLSGRDLSGKTAAEVTLAFAWNLLLPFEACVNAITMLPLLLLILLPLSGFPPRK